MKSTLTASSFATPRSVAAAYGQGANQVIQTSTASTNRSAPPKNAATAREQRWTPDGRCDGEDEHTANQG